MRQAIPPQSLRANRGVNIWIAQGHQWWFYGAVLSMGDLYFTKRKGNSTLMYYQFLLGPADHVLPLTCFSTNQIREVFLSYLEEIECTAPLLLCTCNSLWWYYWASPSKSYGNVQKLFVREYLYPSICRFLKSFSLFILKKNSDTETYSIGCHQTICDHRNFSFNQAAHSLGTEFLLDVSFSCRSEQTF